MKSIKNFLIYAIFSHILSNAKIFNFFINSESTTLPMFFQTVITAALLIEQNHYNTKSQNIKVIL